MIQRLFRLRKSCPHTNSARSSPTRSRAACSRPSSTARIDGIRHLHAIQDEQDGHKTASTTRTSHLTCENPHTRFGNETATDTALELGCGSGNEVAYLARRGIEATGLDLSPLQIKYAQERWGDVQGARFALRDGGGLPQDDRRAV
ncbi:class I SAM-dependent methyltransferase [Streptomyces inhibens]|uniref:class I SAM-dependent methyltransferase n=1 Tax=Streptomyces inhibens TaxID=2293571 RepID=UPI003CC96CC0|nr:class I SAM-dependent methyltransferase [Streptomyces inhibens]